MQKTIEDLCTEDPKDSLGKEEFGDDYVQPSLFMHIIKSLMPGQDLTRVLIPVFFLESRSLLEKFTDILMHVNLLEDPLLTKGTDLERFLCVTKYFLSGWHYKTKGAKKPYNPIIGETFACKVKGEKYTFSFISEQVIHHPPISAFYVECPELDFSANGQIWTKSKFLGNSVKCILEGDVKITIGKDTYVITYPGFVATGLFIGSLATQLCDESVIKCLNTGIEAKLHWHVKPMMWGEYNCVDCEVVKGDTKLCTINGKWNEEFFIRKSNNVLKSFLKISKLKIYPKICLDIQYQGEFESRRLWNVVTAAIRQPNGPDWKTVEVEKTRLGILYLIKIVEDEQRTLPIHQTGDQYKDWDRKLFHLEKDETLGKEVWTFNSPLRSGMKDRDLLILSRDSNMKDLRVKSMKSTEELLAEMNKAE